MGTASRDAPTRHAHNHAHRHAVTDATGTAGAPDAPGTVTQVVPPVASRTAKAESLSPRPARADAARIALGLVDQAATTLAEEDVAAGAQVAVATTA